MDDNLQNKNAGNGGDLVKHTVYLATLDFLLNRKPWSQGMNLRECHAGRGIYYVSGEHKSRTLLSCLHSIRTPAEATLLQSSQSRILRSLACWPDCVQNVEQRVEWYVGSALINAQRLADDPGSHTLDLYELLPETRKSLRCALTDMQLPTELSWDVLSDKDGIKDFDGEAYIAREMGKWGGRDLILLDPFAMWISRDDKKQRDQRDRYGRIFDALVQCRSEAVSLILFWTWGSRHQAEAKNDLDNMARAGVNCGYQELRSKLHGAGLEFVRIKWCWGQWFAMWVIMPSLSHEHLTQLECELQKQVTALWKRCANKRTELEVKIDRP